MHFKNTGYLFFGLLVLVIIGFWPSYFSKFFDGTANFTHYFHFHAVTASLWLISLIAQPVLIQKKKLDWHRLVGKFSYVLVPLIYLSVMLLAHHRTSAEGPGVPRELWIPFKDLIIFSYGYGIAIYFKKQMQIHARGMIVAGMALIEPTMARVMMNVLNIPPPTGYLLGISTIYIILILLIIRELKEPGARWVFRGALGLFAFIHSVVILRCTPPFWESFAHWFMSLPLT